MFREIFSHKHAGTVYPKKYAHGFCFAVLCCGYTLTDFPISIGLTSLALWQFNHCPSASKATLMNMDKYHRWIHYERLHNHKKAKHNKNVCIFLGIYCTLRWKRVAGLAVRMCVENWVNNYRYWLDARTLKSYLIKKTRKIWNVLRNTFVVCRVATILPH